MASITDGTSNTITIAEAVAVGEDNYGFWWLLVMRSQLSRAR